MLFSLFAIAQTSINSTIIDSKTKLAIPYCNVFNKSIQRGTISNADGEFSIKIHSLDDTIRISFLGYWSRNIQARKILEWSTISLKPKQYQLEEVIVHSNNDYIYDILVGCKKRLKKSDKEQISKAFFILNTSSNQQSLELLECYYNARQIAGKLDDLYLKNGRFALQPLDSRFFLNLSTSQVFNKIDLVEKNKSLPSIILQFGKRRMKSRYKVKLEYCDTTLDKIYFSPIKKDNSFTGEIWIDKNSYSIKKISLYAKNINKHPFVALGNDSLANISLKTSFTYTDNDKITQIDHIEVNMQMTYFSRRAFQGGSLPNIKRDIEINTVLYFYDFGKPFILPYFEYNNLYGDYRKMSIIPYNKSFWETRKLLLTKEQIQQIKLMKKKGVLINYNKNEYGKNFMMPALKELKTKPRKGFWENTSYLFWSLKERIILKKDIIEEQKAKPYYNTNIPSDMYNFKVQILLDINPIDSLFDCKSYTVFDLTKTFYSLEENEYSNVFINIYFDICEIERRKMEKELMVHNKSLHQIDSIYYKTFSNLKKITYKYKKEVQHGNNLRMLKKWNDYVKDELGIDNLNLFQQ
jgi:hypothetical protein